MLTWQGLKAGMGSGKCEAGEGGQRRGDGEGWIFHDFREGVSIGQWGGEQQGRR